MVISCLHRDHVRVRPPSTLALHAHVLQRQWVQASDVELAYTPTGASWLDRIESHFTALRYFTLDDTDHTSHAQQASMIRRYITWRDRHGHDKRLGRIIKRANVA